MQRIVEALYAAREYTPAEMLEAARDRGHNPYRAHLGSSRVMNEDGTPGAVTWEGEIICGHNPHLLARVARVWLEGAAVRYQWACERPQLDLRGHRTQATYTYDGDGLRTTNTTATTTATPTYTAYGTPTTNSTPPSPLGYTGQYTDPETGLIWLRARYYDPHTAQFLTPDPLTTLTHAVYTYAEDDPITGSDPTGLWGWRETFEAVAVGLAIGATVATFGGAAIVGAALAVGSVTVDAGFVVNDCRGESMSRDCTQSIVNLGVDAILAPLGGKLTAKALTADMGGRLLSDMEMQSDRLVASVFGGATVLTTFGTWLQRLPSPEGASYGQASGWSC